MNKFISALYYVGASMILVGAGTYITKWTPAPYIYVVGAGLFALAQINSPYRGTNVNIKRLRRQQIIGSIALVLAGIFMFVTQGNEWIACLTIAAVLELYTAYRIPQEERKEKEI
ncbi:hypothetical protein EZS27_009586 [termite gut metagenome]|uniref:Acid-resistance membrane protein n=1 Tax=termite gut metagenome TaxID=433724 RepID=A0A5J4S969_9ZZZZ